MFAHASYGPNGGLLGRYLVRLGFHPGDYERLVSGRTLAASEAYLWDPVVAADGRGEFRAALNPSATRRRAFPPRAPPRPPSHVRAMAAERRRAHTLPS